MLLLTFFFSKKFTAGLSRYAINSPIKNGKSVLKYKKVTIVIEINIVKINSLFIKGLVI